MSIPTRLLGAIVGLVVLWLGASGVLLVTAVRVGADADTSYGAEYAGFQKNWGGQLEQGLPVFLLGRVEVLPVDTDLAVQIDHGPKRHGWLTFQAYTVSQVGRYVVKNTGTEAAPLSLRVDSPAGAVLVHDFTVTVDGEKVAAPRIGIADRLGELAPGASLEVVIALATNGTDRYSLALSRWNWSMIPHFRATLDVNTSRFALLRYGLPHTRDAHGDGERVVFDISDFQASQDVGLTFVDDGRDDSLASDLMLKSPLSAGLLLFGTFVWAQVRGRRVEGFRWVFLAMSHCFYFMFLAYLVRYTRLELAAAAGAVAATGAFAVTLPPALGPAFAWRTAFPLFLAMTVGYTALFLVPVFQGVLFLCFLFAGFMGVVAPFARSDLRTWPALRPDEPVPAEATGIPR